jgi:integrase
VGVTVRKKNGRWFVFVSHAGQRKAKCIGESRAAATQVKKVLEAKLALGDLGIFEPGQLGEDHEFGVYAESWITSYADLGCKASTVRGYRSILDLYLKPRYSGKALGQVSRNEVKRMIVELIDLGLSRSTVRNAISVLRGIFNHALDDGIIQANPAANLGRLTRSARTASPKGIALTGDEVDRFLEAAKDECPEYWVLFLIAVRAGLRRGELVALTWGDIEFGKDETDGNRYILVRNNYVHRQFTTTKSKRVRRVDMSRELRKALWELFEKRRKQSNSDRSNELIFTSQAGGVLDPDNLYYRLFRPVLSKSGIRKIRLHDLRHTFGSLLIQKGASLVYVREQLGHSSIQVTADIYGHLVPGADVRFVDLLDGDVTEKRRTQGQDATPAQPTESAARKGALYVVDFIGGGGQDRTADLRVMNPSL